MLAAAEKLRRPKHMEEPVGFEIRRFLLKTKIPWSKIVVIEWGTVPCSEEINGEQGKVAVVNYFTEMFSSERLKKI